ncbi:phosphoribosyltransferase family protein [Agrococcus sp. Marseille-Q4369]|uniref:ComF family protein n=1 Tax=Agrococcus sp. Marseille-Q4369 TaxID=2810513 RepID=UPI001B8AAB3D|nr:phosphoribosyltransferase family protein [Agrococcus sp. Marseille-Q4369]QUW19746.1 ComF family protein [Agrococcus sp. Marseille-Q4369]
MRMGSVRLSALVPALREAASVLWPVECAGCGALDTPVCRACAGLLLAGPEHELLDGVPLVAAARYEGAVRALVGACKERGDRATARALGAGLALAIASAPAGELVRVPSSRAGLRQRGFDPVELVLRGAGLTAVPLRRVAGRAPPGAQKERSAEERALAARGSLELGRRDRARLAGAAAVLVDDVVTSGATAREGVRALRAAGCRPVAIVAVARTERRLSARPADARTGGVW